MENKHLMKVLQTKKTSKKKILDNINIRIKTPPILDKESVDHIFRIFQKNNPNPRSELDYKNTYTLLVAVTLSAQATDVGVNKATRDLFSIIDTPQKMVELGEEGLKDYIKSLNYYNTKARNVVALSRMLIETYNGNVPNTIEELEKLPGVGRKTASVVANVAFGKPYIAVDTHIFRVANRLPLVHTSTPLETQSLLEQLIPKEFLLYAHHWLILHGRYICKARKPDCPQCPVAAYCRFPDKTR